jgi:hypothetical protein
MNKDVSNEPGLEKESDKRPSWPYPQILFLYIVIFLLSSFLGKVISFMLFSGVVLASIWAALSRKQYDQLKKQYPSVSRNSYIANMLLLPVMIPLLVLLLLMLWF